MSEDELASTLDDSRRREKKPPGEVLFADELVDLGFLARGGMGEVRRVRDTRLNRVLAVKVLHHELVDDERAHARFLAEAQATSQLQHPGIVAVHSRGELDDGRPWFTMTEIRGRTLAQVLREARAGAADAWNLREQVEALRRACQAVAHAHDNGVVHRDLKPANIMVGAFGEVLVLDWGLARLVAGESAPRERLVETGDAPVTRAGQVMGTPTHMAPEQAMGGTVGPSADVHALGAILHEMLTGELPYGRDADEAWRRVRRGPRPSPIHRTPTGRPAPPLELVETCERALERDPARRPADATELSREITAWLDGARKREQALELVEEADARRPLLDDRARRVAQLREEARELLGSVAPHEPASRKQAGWEKEDQARELELALATAEVEQLQLLRSALSLAPDLDEARDRLADHHRTRLLEAESRRDAEEAARQEALLKAQASAQHQRWLDAEGALTLVSDPPGARVTLHVHVLHRRRLLRGPGRELGETPLHEVPLPRGSHALRLRLPGHEDTWQLVQVERGEHWTSTRPGDDEPHPVKLPPLGEIADDEVHVPAGWTWIGGDPLAPDGLARRRCWIDGFVVRRHPVTHEQHLAFLDELVRRGRGDEALAHAPQEIAAVVGHATKVALDRDDCGRFILPAASDGPTWRLDEPVVQVDWHAAAAHARWASERTGRPWRLLHDLEWEKAARGVDGRCFPWGDHLEPSWTVMLQSHAGRPQQASVSERPSDESPWGVRGMAGNVRDWCLNAYRREGPADELVSVDVDDEREDELRLVRGGSWNSNEAYCRLAGRFAIEPGSRFAAVGFRLARPFPER